MAYTPIYTRKNFVNNSAPAINATNLNDIEDALVSLENGLQTAAADTDTNTAAISTIQGEISDINDLIDAILPDDSESGNPAVITDAFAGECKSLVLTLEPIQSGSGTPAPDNIRNLSGRTQSNIYHYRKNLFNAAAITRRYASNPQTRLETGSIVKVNAGDKIVFSTDYAGIQFGIIIFNDANKTTSLEDSGWLNPNAAYTFQNDGFICLGSIGIRNADNAEFSDADIATLKNAHTQLEFNSSATSYEAYSEETITRAYGQTVYNVTDEITGAGASESDAFVANMAALTWVDNGTYPNCFNGTLPIVAASQTIEILCSRYPVYTSGEVMNHDYGIAIALSGQTVYIKDKDCSNVGQLLTALSGVQLCYKRAAAVWISLTSNNLTLQKGDNVITTDGDALNVEFKADPVLYAIKQIGG